MIEQKDVTAKVKEFAKEILTKGNPKWDWPHAQAAAYYAKLITEEVYPDEPEKVWLMELTGYLHDIGYSHAYKLEGILNRDEYMEAKKKHGFYGRDLATPLLHDLSLNDEQIEFILHLIVRHDDLEEITAEDEILFMEADTLAALDITKVSPSFNKQENEAYMSGILKRRLPLFRHQVAKDLFAKCYRLRKEYFAKLAD